MGLKAFKLLYMNIPDRFTHTRTYGVHVNVHHSKVVNVLHVFLVILD